MSALKTSANGGWVYYFAAFRFVSEQMSDELEDDEEIFSKKETSLNYLKAKFQQTTSNISSLASDFHEKLKAAGKAAPAEKQKSDTKDILFGIPLKDAVALSNLNLNLDLKWPKFVQNSILYLDKSIHN